MALSYSLSQATAAGLLGASVCDLKGQLVPSSCIPIVLCCHGAPERLLSCPLQAELEDKASQLATVQQRLRGGH